MHVIGGQERGRRLKVPTCSDTRPATARIRASIFSRLASRNAIIGARVLDVFAGSGALGIEALSRGAGHVVFVDHARPAASAIRHNLGQLGLTERGRIINADFRRALPELAGEEERFGLVFVDAPFRADSTTEVLALIATLRLLAPDGIVVTRQFHRTPVPATAAMACFNLTKIGDHRIALYRRLPSGDTSKDDRTPTPGGQHLTRAAAMSEKEPHGE